MATTYENIGIDDLFEDTNNELADAYKAENTLYTGTYLTKVTKLIPKRNNDDAPVNPGRSSVTLAVTFYDKDDATEKRGTGFISTSNEPRYYENGKLDADSNRYMELAKAMGIPAQNAKAVYRAAETTMFLTRVNEQYEVPEEALHESHLDVRVNDRNGKAYITLNSEDTDEREHYQSLGFDPKVKAVRITKVK